MRKKTLIIIIVVVAIAAIAAAGAFAWWSNTATLPDNTISTGGIHLSAGDSAMNFTGFMPGSAPQTQWMWVRNDGSQNIMMYAYVRVQDGWDPAVLNYVNANITLAPSGWPGSPTDLANSLGGTAGGGTGDYPVYSGVVADLLGAANGKLYLRTITPDGTTQTPMTPGQYALYKVVLSLDQNTPNSFQDQTVKCDIVFVGGQVESGLTLDF